MKCTHMNESGRNASKEAKRVAAHKALIPCSLCHSPDKRDDDNYDLVVPILPCKKTLRLASVAVLTS